MELREKDTRKVVAGLKRCTNDLADCTCCYLFGEDRCRKVLLSDALEHIKELEREVEYFSEKHNEACIELAKEREAKWISMEEKMPEHMESVLIYDHKNKRIAICCCGNCSAEDVGSFYSHWMPLPEPPKPKEPTFKDKFLEMFPKAELNNFRVPVVCAGALFSYLKDSCNTSDCSYNGREYQEKCYVCWSQPYFEEEGEGE